MEPASATVTCLSILSFLCRPLREPAEGAITRAGEKGFSSLGSWLDIFFHFGRNTHDLDKEMGVLRGLRSGLENEVVLKEEKDVKRTDRVDGWLKRVDGVDVTVSNFLTTNASSCCCCPPCGFCCLCVPCELDELRRQVITLKGEIDDLGPLVARVPPPRVVSLSGTSVINPARFESQVKEILELIDEEAVAEVGVYGMCGVGKTQLLLAVNNELFRRSRERTAPTENPTFSKVSMVIYVDLKKELQSILPTQEEQQGQQDLTTLKERNKLVIQKQIRERLRLSDSDDLLEAISSRKCLLLLDHVWDALRWVEIGVPFPGQALKVVFATPSRSVCDDMGVNRVVRVNTLSEEESWDLFDRKMEGLYQESWRKCKSHVKDLAKRVIASCCGGLPAAIVAIPPALRMDFTARQAWEEIRDQLKNSPDEVKGMIDVFSSLQCCFDRLETSPVQMSECLLYCILFPESHNISRDRVIDYWIGEGFLGADGSPAIRSVRSVRSVRKKGSRVIDKLQKACLLEIGYSGEGEVRLHSVIRQMALWFTRHDTHKFLTSVRLKSLEMSAAESWQRATRISLMDSNVKELPDDMSKCPNLLTLLLNKHDVGLQNESRCMIDDGLHDVFNFLPALRVLDLSGTNIIYLPSSVGSLVGLKYLNVSHTNIESLPVELKELVNLRLLNLRDTAHLSRIPHEAISPLKNLQSVDLYCSGYEWSRERRYLEVNDGGRNQQERQISFEDLADVSKSLQELGISLRNLPTLEAFLGCTITSPGSKGFLRSKTFLRSTTYLSLVGVSGLREHHAAQVFDSMPRLRELSVCSCAELRKLKFRTDHLQELNSLSLRDLPLTSIETEEQSSDQYPLPDLCNLWVELCHQLSNLTCVKEFRGLQKMSLTNCNGMLELIADRSPTNDDTSLSELQNVSIVDLPSFSRFSSHTLSLPALEYIKVIGSPNLKKLPLGPNSRSTIKKIYGERTWWDGLEWDHDGDVDHFRECFEVL